jgi:MFS family permease
MIAEFKSIFKKPGFMYLWGSQIFSQVTIHMLNFLLLAHLYEATNSTIATSLLWVAYALPALFIGPIGAASVDLVSRRKTLMIANLLQALTVFVYIFINQQSIFILYAIALIYSSLNQFYGPAELATLPGTVGKKMLARANSLFFTTSQAALILGFGFAGILQKLIGFNGTLILATTLLFLAFVSVSFLTEVKPKKKLPVEFEKVLKTFFNTIVEGYVFIKSNKTVLFPLLILLGIQATLAIMLVNLPVIAAQILNISVSYSGVSLVVPAGIGALLGATYIPSLIKKGWRKKRLIDAGLIITVIALVAMAIGIPLLPIAVRLTFTSFLIIATGIAFVAINIPALTFLQESTPQWFRGRVFGNLWFMTSIISIIPVLFTGAISEIFGVKTLLVLMAAGILFVFLYSKKRGQILIVTHLNSNGKQK